MARCGPATPINKCVWGEVFVKDNNQGHSWVAVRIPGNKVTLIRQLLHLFIFLAGLSYCVLLHCYSWLRSCCRAAVEPNPSPLPHAVHFNKESGNLAPTFFSVKKGQASGVNTGGWGEKLVSISSLPPA